MPLASITDRSVQLAVDEAGEGEAAVVVGEEEAEVVEAGDGVRNEMHEYSKQRRHEFCKKS